MEDRGALERWLRRDAALHLYELGDLDDFFFPNTEYLGLFEGDTMRALGLLYDASDPTVLVAMGRDADHAALHALLEALRDRLPTRVYTHLAPGTRAALASAFDVGPVVPHDRMVLVDRAAIDAVDTSMACALDSADEREIFELFARAYPGNWFVPRMLETGTYFGVRRASGAAAGGPLVAVAGVHVVSRSMRVAALGNITTDPHARGQGLARVATAAVCKALAPHVDTIGLNVESTNAPAIALYRRLGFETVAVFEEAMATRRIAERPAS